MGQKLDNVISLYLGAVRDGNLRESAEKHTGDVFKQHTTGVFDGVEGFVEYYTRFIQQNPHRDIRIVRAIEDEKYAFIHAYQDLNGQKSVLASFFAFDQHDKITEQWSVVGPYAEKTPSEHTSLDGDVQIEDEHLTEENKFIVKDMIESLLMPNGDKRKIDSYISDSEFIQHNVGMADGIENFRPLIMNKDSPLRYERIVLIAGQGNFVATLSEVTLKEVPYAWVDVFRLKDQKIVEHWDINEQVKEHDVNSGKF